MFAHGDGGPEPEWVKTEREQFSDFRDLNKDGKMDADEIRHWIMPQDYDHAQAEARHLVYESDKDKVLRLTCVTSTSAAVHHLTDLAPHFLFPGPDADQRRGPRQLEHVCWKSGHQLW